MLSVDIKTTKLSSNGKVTIPKQFKTRHHWKAGQELSVIETVEGMFLKPVSLFAETSLSDVAGCLEYSGSPRSIEEMEQITQRRAKDDWTFQ
jgi:bifunctional DNA-binding transcriptional regulator/antitoxin component of YhaV-PrlF toxin-antitoxin module